MRMPKKMPAPKKAGLTPKGVAGKRAANNAAKKRLGLQNKVTDNDPMARESDNNYP